MARLDIDGPGQALRRFPRRARRVARRRRRRVPGAAGPLRLRQDHDAAHGRGLHRADRRAGEARRHATSPCCRPGSATPAWCSRTTPCSRTSRWRRTWPSAWRCARSPRPRSRRASRRPWRWCASTGLGGRLPRQLSGGQQQRVALARALAIRPDVLLLDEPLSNLDAKLRQEVRVEIRELQRKLGLTTVMVTHDQEEALTMADRLVVMSEGAVRQVGSQRDLYERPADRFVAGFVGRSTFLEGTLEAPGRFRTDGGLMLACSGGDPGRGVLALRPERVEVRPGAAGRTRQRPAGHGGIRLLSRRTDRHPCAPVAERPRGGADRQPRRRLCTRGRRSRSMSAGRRRPAGYSSE